MCDISRPATVATVQTLTVDEVINKTHAVSGSFVFKKPSCERDQQGRRDMSKEVGAL